MTDHSFDDETLMAYADGELDTETAARLETALREDTGLAERLAIFSGTRDALAEAAAVARKTSVPDTLTERVQETVRAARESAANDTVVSLANRRPTARLFHPVALAAGFATLGLVTGLVLSPSTPGPGNAELQFTVLEGAAVPDALDRVQSGERTAITGGEIEIIASFLSQDGALCREFELDRSDAMTVVAVACRTGTDWAPRFAVVAAAADDTTFAPASSMEALDAYLTAIGASAPMTLEEERQRLASPTQ
ncbi:MAG: anti-sigma factor [Pseudomonadota bacterium]